VEMVDHTEDIFFNNVPACSVEVSSETIWPRSLVRIHGPNNLGDFFFCKGFDKRFVVFMRNNVRNRNPRIVPSSEYRSSEKRF